MLEKMDREEIERTNREEIEDGFPCMPMQDVSFLIQDAWKVPPMCQPIAHQLEDSPTSS